MPSNPSRDDHADALESMATGNDISGLTGPTPPTSSQAGDPNTPPEAVPVDSEPGEVDDIPMAMPIEGGHPDDGSAHEDLAQTMAVSAPLTPGQKKARMARTRVAARQAQHHQLRKVMAPLLLVSGGLLIILGLAVLMFKGGGANDNGLVSRGMARALTFAAFPLGGILILGGWWFHHESKQS